MPPVMVAGANPVVSGQGEGRVVVPNDVDPLHAGPFYHRLIWKGPTSVLRTQPITRPRGQATWDELCIATDYETGQLHGDVGTPENPQLTYKEVIHNQRSGKAMTLHVGNDILSEEADHLIQSSGPSMGKLRRAVEESDLPFLPQGVLPGGWDALGRPWVPFYFPDMAHLDRAIQVWNKASRKRPTVMDAQLQDDRQVKGAKITYERLMLPGYRHSVPILEMLKETRQLFGMGRATTV